MKICYRIAPAHASALPELVFFPVLGYNGIPSLCSRPLKYTCREVPHEKNFPPRRRLWPAAALLCLLALPLLLPRLSGGRSAPPPPPRRRRRPTSLCTLPLSLHPAPLPEQPGGPDTGAGDPGLYGPALPPRSPGAARAGVLSHRLAWGRSSWAPSPSTPPSGEEDVRPVLLPGGGRHPLLLAAARRPSPGPGRPSGRAAGL